MPKGKLDLYALGQRGVNVSKNPLQLTDDELLQAQNAILSYEQGRGALRKRGGLEILNGTALNSGASVLAIKNVPLPIPSELQTASVVSQYLYVADPATGAMTWTGGAINNGPSVYQDVIWCSALGLFVASGAVSGGGAKQIATSPDGTTWTARTAPPATGRLSYDPTAGVIVCGGSTGLATSTDGINWTDRTVPVGTGTYQSGAYSPTLDLWAIARWAAGSNNPTTQSIATAAAAGVTWTAQTTPNHIITDVAWSPSLGLFVGVGGDSGGTGYAISSADGVTWTTRTIGGYQWLTVFWSDALAAFVAVTYNRIATSTDGINWTDEGAPAATGLNQGFAWAESLSQGMFVTDTPEYYTTEDFQTYSALAAITAPYGSSTFNPAYLRGAYSSSLDVFVFAAGNASTYEHLTTVPASGGGTRTWRRTPDGTTWAAVDEPAAPYAVAPYVAAEAVPAPGPGSFVYWSRLTDYRSIYAWDNTSDGLLASVVPPVSVTVLPQDRLMAACWHNGAIYFGYWRYGTGSPGGRVFKLDTISGQLTVIGGELRNGALYLSAGALLSWNGLLFASGSFNPSAASPATSAVIFRINPDTETSWTADTTISSGSPRGATNFASFLGKLYVGIVAASGSAHAIYSRTASAAWSAFYNPGGAPALALGYPVLGTHGSTLVWYQDGKFRATTDGSSSAQELDAEGTYGDAEPPGAPVVFRGAQYWPFKQYVLKRSAAGAWSKVVDMGAANNARLLAVLNVPED